MSTNQMSNPKYFNLLRGVSEITAWGTILLLGGGQIVTAFALASQFGLGVTLVTLCTAALTIVGALTGLALVYAFMALVESSIDSRNRLFASNTAGG
jgi:phage shock protein PspC (stress-responsive transcriptional regulator)